MPGLVFSLLFVLNLFVWAQASSTAIPFTTLLALAALWCTVQAPLVYLGSYLGFFHSSAWEPPTRTSPIPRQIPAEHWYTRNATVVAILAGLIPFAVLFIELLFVMKSLWLDKSGYYYVFGYLSIVSALLAITIAEVTIITTYLQLCAENYHWWWQSFITGGSLSLWVFAYSVWYLWTRLHIGRLRQQPPLHLLFSSWVWSGWGSQVRRSECVSHGSGSGGYTEASRSTEFRSLFCLLPFITCYTSHGVDRKHWDGNIVQGTLGRTGHSTVCHAAIRIDCPTEALSGFKNIMMIDMIDCTAY